MDPSTVALAIDARREYFFRAPHNGPGRARRREGGAERARHATARCPRYHAAALQHSRRVSAAIGDPTADFGNLGMALIDRSAFLVLFSCTTQYHRKRYSTVPVDTIATSSYEPCRDHQTWRLCPDVLGCGQAHPSCFLDRVCWMHMMTGI